MNKYKEILMLFSILLLTALACNLPSSQPTPTPVTEVDVNATLTSIALTQSGSSLATPLQPVDTPTATFTPTTTPTGTPTIPMVSVSVDTNCRTGPGVVYPYLTALLVGEKAEVIGKYTATSPSYWIIKKGNVTCWLWGQYATVEGNVANLPEMIPPPSPTPTFTATPTSTPTTPPAGDLYIVDVFMSTQFEVIVRVGVNPPGSMSGNFQYIIYANGSQTALGTCAIPTGTSACYTGHIVGGVETIEVGIDVHNTIPETDETNNLVVVVCDKFSFTCN